MIILSLGANLPSRYGTPEQTLAAAVKSMETHGIMTTQRSRLWRTAPVPYNTEHPYFTNACVVVETDLSPSDLMHKLIDIETEFGRKRTVKNAPRLLDLDLIVYDDQVVDDKPHLLLPHPRLGERAFVLRPMFDIVQNWVHPETGETIQSLIDKLPESQRAIPSAAVW